MNKIVKIDDIEGKVYELDDWKPEQSTQVKKYFTEKFKELQKEYNRLIQDFNWNKIIFESEIMFTPVIGKTYYLYKNNNGKKILSLIDPDSWGENSHLKYIASFKQDSKQKWNLVDLND